ncbi:unnamed protein product [Phytophthora lilii]|uniref:Unnamed protein product n=1 Tax=Phytophthora lilii TaxID=2077276 RepID=A0A9W6WZV6_9STRA|nr:unnamed protein product [Phytophthora lilii]
MKKLERPSWSSERRPLVFILAFGLVILPLIVLALSRACSPLVAYSGLNATLNELFVRGLHVTLQGFAPTSADGSIESANIYIHSATENYTLFRDDSLYRRTTGFHGDLAFDVNVSSEDPPNVVHLVVESFRFHDSHYLVGEKDPSNLFKGTNITVTPNFDKWAKRGVAFSNMWSSWRTSRSIESLLFAQLPFDSAAYSGTSGGQKGVELSGLPQLFKAKGYEPYFTTGCKANYDDWNTFLPSHGFETVWSRDEMMEMAESYLNITSDEWYGDAHRGFNWGVYDDLSFQLLGDLLINKTHDQSARVAKGKDKKPLFVIHYTISSHTPFRERPQWYADAMKPDFSALYEGENHAKDVQAYLEMRYFTDMQLGKFLDRMSDEGILNDTIIVIVGDHGQGPEAGLSVPEAREVSATRVAGTIIAEGRLGDSVGLMIEDAVEQYDILNTLADITGVPDGGFLQDGIGRSLKRNVTFGERIVYSNNPSPAALIAEGRLGKYAGLKIEDAAEQYDMLNTFADITGVPEEGFLQDGVGRSLKRNVTFGDRAIFSNNPAVKNSIVRGHARLRYDRSTDSVLLHDAYIDQDMKHDLFPALSMEKKNQWREWRDLGREVTAYYKK